MPYVLWFFPTLIFKVLYLNSQRLRAPMSLKHLLLVMCLPLLLAGCGAMPASGPYQSRVGNGATVKIRSNSNAQNSLKYAMVELSGTVVEQMSKRPYSVGGDVIWPVKTSHEIVKVNVGDTIQVTIYEAQSGGLFIPKEAGVRPGNFIALPPQTVESGGYITVPYVGLVKAVGRSTVDIGKSIATSLSDRAIEPQVVVSFSDRRSSEVSVIGAVEDATRFSLSFSGDKILDAIARAGGPSFPGYETWVSLQRNDQEYTLPFDRLILDSTKNIYVQSNDTLYLYRQPKKFIVYGAAQSQGSIDFGKRNLFLSEALGLANGLNDTQADPAEIYIYRHEKSAYLESLVSADFDVHDMVSAADKTVPVIYRLNLRDPNGFFLAQKFPMREDDVIYIANAKSVEFLKFLNILNSAASTATNVKATKNAY